MIAQDCISEGDESSLGPVLDAEFQRYIITVKVNRILYENIRKSNDTS